MNLSSPRTIPHRPEGSANDCVYQRQPRGSLRGLDHEQSAELERLRKVLNVAQRNGNALFIENIEREIAAVERGEPSPLIEAYLTEEERSPHSESQN